MIELMLAADQLLATGDLDRAERIFRQVADSDPRNAIAVVGLARVAEARGRTEEALELVARALALDPEDVAAQRLHDTMSSTVFAVPAPEPISASSQSVPTLPEEPGREEPVPGPAPSKRGPSVIERIRAYLGIGGSSR